MYPNKYPYHQSYYNNYWHRRKQQPDYVKLGLFIIIIGLLVYQFLQVANNPAAY